MLKPSTNASQRLSGESLGVVVGRDRQVAHHAEAAGTAGAAGLAAVVVQVAAPAPFLLGEELDHVRLALDELEGGEGQAQARAGLARRLAHGRRQAVVVEGGRLLQGRGVDHDELEAARDRLAVVEAVRVLDPGRGVGEVLGQPGPGVAQAERALVVGLDAAVRRRGVRVRTQPRGGRRRGRDRRGWARRRLRGQGCGRPGGGCGEKQRTAIEHEVHPSARSLCAGLQSLCRRIVYDLAAGGSRRGGSVVFL